MITKKNISIPETLKKLKPIDFMYPGIFILFLSVIIVVFFTTMQFISKNINKAFAPEEGSPSQALNIEKYKAVTKKLNIPVASTDNTVSHAEIPTIQVVATSTPVIILDKKNITIIVKNSTTKSGIATTLAKALEDGGFSTPKTGNESKPYATTTVLVKESKSEYKNSILEVVRKIYPDAIEATAPDTATTDAVIVIGAK